MPSLKLDRTRGSIDCPLGVQVYNTHRIMEKFSFIHWHPQIELLFIIKGSYEFYSPDGSLSLQAGNIYIVPPGEDHALRSLEKSGTYWSVVFSLDMVSGNQNHYLQNAFVTPLMAGTLCMPRYISRTEPIYKTILEQITPLLSMSVDSEIYKLSGHVAANTICAALSRKCTVKTTQITGVSREHDVIKTCVQYIQTHYSGKITLKQLADLVHLHPNYLCGIFKKHIGISVSNYITSQRVHAVNTLLQTTNLSLQQIADRTGFNSVSYLSRTFRKEYGIPPAAFAALYEKNRKKD